MSEEITTTTSVPTKFKTASQPILPGIAEKKRRVRKFKEDYIVEASFLKLEERNKELVGYKRGLFSRLFRKKGRND